MKKSFLILLVCGAALGLLIVPSLSCVTSYETTTTTPFGMTEDEIKAYIIADCPLVKERLQDILGDPSYELTKAGFAAIRDWVTDNTDNIEYMSDEEQWGVDDYWQTPEEALSLGTGDCEDFGILLSSLLRAYGINEEHVYVALGVDDGGYGHAFLVENWYLDGEWRAVELQAPTQVFPGPPKFNLVDAKLDDFEIIVGFNDVYYHDESFPWDDN